MKHAFIAIAAAFSLVTFAAGAYAEAEVGQAAPAFTLTDITGKTHSLSDFAGKHVVLEWTNYDCPFVKKHYGSGNMQKLQAEYTSKGVVWLSVNSSAPGKQGNFTPEEWQKRSREWNVAATGILLDADGKVGQAYGAKTTPHIFIVAPDGKLAYKGAIDDKPSADPADIESSKNYVKEALDAQLAGGSVPEASTKSYGCSVKY